MNATGILHSELFRACNTQFIWITHWPMLANEQKLMSLLDDLGIKTTLYRHPPFFTVEDGRTYHEKMPGGHCKCLFLKDKKEQMVLAIIHEDLKVNLKNLSKNLALGRFSFCDQDRLERILGVTPGAVTPFALMNVSKSSLKDKESLCIVFDKHLETYDIIHFHPLHNEATVAIAPDDLLKFIRHFSFDPVIMDLA